MMERQVILPITVRYDIDEIADYIIGLNTREHAVQYVRELLAEISELSFLADTLPVSTSPFILQYHKNAKRYNIKHGVWCVIFLVENNYVIIDKILPSKLVLLPI